jgi:5'-nucleotidase
MKQRPTILISNDDGIGADGIIALAEEIKKFANIIVVAPHTQQSAVGHSITMANPIRATKTYVNKKFFGYAVEGTPADSVKLAVHTLLKDKKIHLLISGINQGANTAINTLYSGTVSAATEGRILGLPSFAISLTSYVYKNFSPAAKFASHLAKMILKNGLPEGTLLNVNVPAVSASKIKGVKITRQGKSSWDDTYEKRLDPNNREYYWLTGRMVKEDDSKDYDVIAVENNYISVTPIHYDLTDYNTLEEMKKWKF